MLKRLKLKNVGPADHSLFGEALRVVLERACPFVAKEVGRQALLRGGSEVSPKPESHGEAA